MANENTWATLSQATLQSSGASAAAAAIVAGGTLATSTHSNYTGVDLVLTGTMAASIAAASNYFSVYARAINIDGTNDAPVPGASFKAKYVGAIQFAGSSASAAQTGFLENVETSWADVEFYLENNCNATLNAGWTLKATPKTNKPAA
jgi:hypothetical protein